MIRHRFVVTGQVQGVGFRPFVYRVAMALGLTGQVGNTSQGVRIEVQGLAAAVAAFGRTLHNDLPPLARIAELREAEEALVENEQGFVIVESHGETGQAVLVSPDMGTCPACLEELFDKRNRRYLYPFINCTDCGPRLTITRSLPYDRATTSMACFPQCPACLAEYGDPGHRRFHAQPNACPTCGPRLWLTDAAGNTLVEECVLEETARHLADGAIVALKGLGGFHLVCDARNVATLERLRARKGRPHQSLAVMVADIEAARSVARLGPAEERELTSARRPIVAVTGRPEAEGGLPELVAPDLPGVGLMLPYTPLHHVLLHLFGKETARDDAALVMTSGNPRGEPLCLGNREAVQRLGAVAEFFVLHDRDILIRADDSVLRVTEDGSRSFMRRARGFVPEPIRLRLGKTAREDVGDVLAVGAELKNTLCLTRGRDAFVSQHLGDMTSLAGHGFFQEVAKHFQGLLGVEPQVVVRDSHPDYQTSVWAEALAAERGVPVLKMQHHAAHVHSVLAEHGHVKAALGLALDGAGFGPDGTVWGGELLLVHPQGAGLPPQHTSAGQICAGGVRLGRLGLMPLPGGDVAAREPWRVACALLAEEARGPFVARYERAMPWLGEISQAVHEGVAELVLRGKMPQTSSCGRLFDAVSAVLGLCSVSTYEGQAAMRLETCQHGEAEAGALRARVLTAHADDGKRIFILDIRDLFMQVVDQRVEGVPVPRIARRFHAGLAASLAELALKGAEVTGLHTVALSGGVMHNATLSRLLICALEKRGLVPLVPQALPPGDGGLSLGQAAWGKFWLQNGADTKIVG